MSRGRAALLGCIGWLVACGGGTDQIEPFAPRQIILLGDETTVLTADGKRYGINALDPNGVINCSSAPTWAQYLIANFGMTLDRCNANNVVAQGITRGTPGARAADIGAQIDAQFAASAPSSKDLFVVMVGLNDIIDQFENFSGAKDCDTNPDRDHATPLEAELRTRGEQVAAQVNRLAAADTRIIVITVHDVGLTPYARTRDASALLTCLTSAFNSGLRVNILQDGRFIGLVLADDLTQAMTRAQNVYSLANVTDAACAVAPPDCTTTTLVSGATDANFLWADDRHFGPAFHARLAPFAIARARNNPF
jgi:phospholipase/lecithinase/hemolysin